MNKETTKAMSDDKEEIREKEEEEYNEDEDEDFDPENG